MIATRTSSATGRLGPLTGWAAPLALTVGLAAIVAVRLLVTRGGLDPLIVGGAFGGALALLAIAGRAPRRLDGRTWPRRIGRQRVLATLGGVLVGLGLVGVAVAGASIAGVATVPGIGRPAAPFVPWALITLLVAAAEEGVLRGVLFDRFERAAGLGAAVGLTTLAFALIHVPLYGWHVVPLDIAVGVVFAGLRLWTRGLAAPIAAHAVADLATWWL